MMEAKMECFKQQFFANQSQHLPSWSSNEKAWRILCLCASSYKQCSASTSLRQHIVCLLGSCTTMAHLLMSCHNLVKSNVLYNNSLPTN